MFFCQSLGRGYKQSACDRELWFFEIFNLWLESDGRSWVSYGRENQ